MIHIGGNKLVFKKDILGVFRCDGARHEHVGIYCESVCEPPYKSAVLVDEKEKQTLYLTSLTVRSLTERLKKSEEDVNSEFML